MRKINFLGSMVILILSVSVAAFGQYTGSNGNAALGKVIVASDSTTILPMSNAVDGDPATYCSVPGAAPAWVQIDLGAYYNIDGYGLILPIALELPTSFIVQVSEKGDVWTDLSTQTVSQDSMFTADLVSPDPIRFFRIYMTSKDDPASISEIVVFGDELEVPGYPIALAATNVTTTGFTANWEASERATGYVLSGATDAAFTNEVILEWWDGEVYSYDATGLEPGTEYFYKVRAYNLAGTSNYGNVISLTTEKEAQTITFDALDAVSYGDSDFDLTATATSGLDVSYSSSNDNIATVTGTTLSIVGPGTVTITASQVGDDQYLAATPVDQDLLVNVKDLSVINASADNKVYDGTTDAVVSGATLDGVVAGDDVSLTGADAGVFAQSNVGTALIVTTSMDISGADVAKYNFTAPADFTADITAKELMVTAEDKSREECAANPEFTITYSGFVGTEDESVLDSEAVADCAAEAGSPAGTYDITVSGGAGANYTLVYVTGTLTVNQDATPPFLSVQNFTLQLDASNNGVLLTTDVVTEATDNCAVVETTLSQSVFSAGDIGDVNVDVTVSDAAGNETTETAVVTVLGDNTGIKDAEALEGSVYPNPTYGMVYLELNDFADELAVMDITGKTVLREMNPGQDIAIDLSEFNSGIYVINVKTGEKVQYFKVVKK